MLIESIRLTTNKKYTIIRNVDKSYSISLAPLFRLFDSISNKPPLADVSADKDKLRLFEILVMTGMTSVVMICRAAGKLFSSVLIALNCDCFKEINNDFVSSHFAISLELSQLFMVLSMIN